MPLDNRSWLDPPSVVIPAFAGMTTWIAIRARSAAWCALSLDI